MVQQAVKVERTDHIDEYDEITKLLQRYIGPSSQ